MHTAVYAPVFHDYSDPGRLVELARVAERAGYDAIFIWDHLAIEPAGRLEVVDATVVLAAIAQATSRIRFGAMITPLARRRPWKLAKELNTLDRLSGGRAMLGVGLGEPAGVEFGSFGEDPSPQGRARRLDEGLAILDPLLRGETVTHHGEFYRLTDAALAPRSVQSPRVPIWVAASLPARAGLRRAARWDGVFPIKVPQAIVEGTVSHADWSDWWLAPEELADANAYVQGLRQEQGPYAVTATGRVADASPAAARARLAEFSAAGANWWLEWIDDAPGSYARTLVSIARGAPGR
jgi:alkanesulfonate monooxygenase SsuD/methylene tetrahydromethanopterin reductase-like flavin-dependent oxidoreductase (luciferase family)